jgi:hypothetical protein
VVVEHLSTGKRENVNPKARLVVMDLWTTVCPPY